MLRLSDSWFTGVWGILFISGWLGAVVALKRCKATGDTPFGIALLTVLLIALSIANISNVVQIIVERNKPSYFIVLDLFWPLSNVIMLIVGVMVIIAGKLHGWKRYIPLATGLWFPLALFSSVLDNRLVSVLFGGIYSVIAWTLLAVVVLTSKEEI